MKRTGLGLKIFVGLFLISICTVSGLILVLRLYLSDVFEAKLVQRGVTISRFLANDSVNHILSRKQLALDLMLHEYIQQDTDISYIFITDTSRETLSHTFSGGFPTGFREMNDDDQKGQRTRHIRFGVLNIVDISVPIMDNRLGRLHVGMSLRDMEKEIETILFTVSFVIALFFLVSGIALWIYLRQVVVAPLKTLGKQVRLIGLGGTGDTHHCYI